MAASYSISEHTIECGDHTLSCLRCGGGGSRPVLVLLHGIGSSAASWQAQLESLSQHYDVIAWNAPGYGHSTPLNVETPDTGHYANALAELLDALQIETCFLVGHSLGSLIAARFARTHPSRIHALTLASCALGHANLDTIKRQQLLTSRLDDVRDLGMAGMAKKRGPRLLTPKADPHIVKQVIDNMAQANPHGYTQAAHMLSGGDMLADLRAIDPDLPIQVVYGSQDVITPPQVNQQAASACGSISVVSIPGAGHLVYIEQADAFNNAINAFNSLHAHAHNHQGVSNG